MTISAVFGTSTITRSDPALPGRFRAAAGCGGPPLRGATRLCRGASERRRGVGGHHYEERPGFAGALPSGGGVWGATITRSDPALPGRFRAAAGCGGPPLRGATRLCRGASERRGGVGGHHYEERPGFAGALPSGGGG